MTEAICSYSRGGEVGGRGEVTIKMIMVIGVIMVIMSIKMIMVIIVIRSISKFLERYSWWVMIKYSDDHGIHDDQLEGF